MSEFQIVGYGPDGRPIYRNEKGQTVEEITRIEIMEALEKSAVWKEFNETFEADDELLNIAVQQILGKDPSLDQLQNLLRTIIKSGGALKLRDSAGNRSMFSFQRRAVELESEVEPEPEAPRDRNGRFLSQSQIAWGEMARWSETASSREIQERRRTDTVYASFYRKNLERETAQPIGDDVTGFNPHLNPNGKNPSPALVDYSKKRGQDISELVAFAKEYEVTPAAKVRMLLNPDANPLGWSDYKLKFELASELNLI